MFLVGSCQSLSSSLVDNNIIIVTVDSTIEIGAVGNMLTLRRWSGGTVCAAVFNFIQRSRVSFWVFVSIQLFIVKDKGDRLKRFFMSAIPLLLTFKRVNIWVWEAAAIAASKVHWTIFYLKQKSSFITLVLYMRNIKLALQTCLLMQNVSSQPHIMHNH